MTIVSLSFAYLQVTSGTAMAAAAPAVAPASPPPEPASALESRHGCDSARHSPLYRALKNALLEMTQAPAPQAAGQVLSSAAPAPAGAASPSTPPAAASTAPAASSQPAATAATNATAGAPDLDDAVIDFARALMQALHAEFAAQRRGGDDDDGPRHQHHHRHHHDHGHGAYADPAQRVDALARAILPAPAGTPAPTAAGTPTTGASTAASAAPTATTSEPAAAAGSAAAAASAPATAGSATFVFAAIRLDTGATTAAAPARAGFQQRLLDAFATLQRALGKPVAAGDDALRTELATFLQTLAQQLRGDDDASTAAAAAQPGTLLSTTA